jgi:hypothetical protein
MSTVIVNESHLLTPKKIGSSALKYMSGIFHAYEWERFCSFFCMVFSVDQLVAQVSSAATCMLVTNAMLLLWVQMAYDAINFQTKYENAAECKSHNVRHDQSLAYLSISCRCTTYPRYVATKAIRHLQ